MKTPTLKELTAASVDYIREHWNTGGTSEFDQSINDISREKIKAMQREYGDCWMFKINRYDWDKDKPFMVQYTGQKVYNFEYSGIIPAYDKELEQLLIDYDKDTGYHSGKIMEKINAITDRMYALGGMHLIWA